MSKRAFGIVGYSGSGKTTLIERLLPWLATQGLKVAVIKQSHHDFELDVPGKDTWRHRQAGAYEVLISSPYRWAVMHELHGVAEPSLEEHIARLSPCDLVLVEGFKRAALPKLEVWRKETGKPWLHSEDKHILAVASDLAPPDMRHIDLNDVAAIGRFILDTMNIEGNKPC